MGAGEESFKLGVNQFADLIESEYRASQLGFKITKEEKSGASGMFVADAGVELPDTVECSWKYGNNGCSGGLMTSAFKYIKAAGGLESEKEYPYTSGGGDDSGSCKFSKSKVKATISSYVEVQSEDEDALK